MRLLSFDTSGRGLTAAILKDGVVVVDRNRREIQTDGAKKADRQESVSMLIPVIDEMTVEAELDKIDYDAVVVGIGPGGFTGVRVAVVTARTLGQALRLPVIGIDSLSVAAYNLLDNVYDTADGVVLVVREASKSHVFFAAYTRGDSLPGSDIFELVEVIPPSYKVDGDFLTMAKERLSKVESGVHWFFEESLLDRFASACEAKQLPDVNNSAVSQAKLAYFRLSLKVDVGDDLLAAYPYHLIQPLYLRGASVTLKKGDVIERVETH